MTRSGSGLIALRLSPDLDARLRAAAPSNMSDYVRDAIEQKLASDAPAVPATPGRTGGKRSAGGRCAHRQPSGAYCAKCDSVVP